MLENIAQVSSLQDTQPVKAVAPQTVAETSESNNRRTDESRSFVEETISVLYETALKETCGRGRDQKQAFSFLQIAQVRIQ